MALTEQVLLINQDRVLVETVDLLSQCLKETEDQLQRENMIGTAAFINCVHGNNGDNPTELTRADCADVVNILRQNSADFIMDNIEGDLKFGTGPTRNCYWAKTATIMEPQIQATGGFTPVSQYPSQADVLRAEWGAIDNLRFLTSPLWPQSLAASALGNVVQNIICQGMNAAQYIDLDGYSVQYRYTPPQIAGGPLWLYGTSGFIFAQAPKLSNTNWIFDLRCTLRT